MVTVVMKKMTEMKEITGSHILQPLAFAFESTNASAISFSKGLCDRISQRSGNDRETQFLFQRLRVIMQRCNAVLYGENFVAAFRQ